MLDKISHRTYLIDNSVIGDVYGVRSPPKFMVWIFNCWLKFSSSTLGFYSWIKKFILFLKNSHYWKTFLLLSFSFWIQLFYLTSLAVHFQLALSNYTVKPCNFQLDEQIFIPFYFLLVLIPEPVLYIWPRYMTASYFKLILVYFQLNFWIFVNASMIIGRDKRSLCWGGRWQPIDLHPQPFRPSCLVKRWSR